MRKKQIIIKKNEIRDLLSCTLTIRTLIIV